MSLAMNAMKKPLLPALAILSALVPALLAASPVAAQTGAQDRLAPPSPEVQQTIQNAMTKYRSGDLKGAIALLEPLKKASGTHPAALSLLGSLYLDADRPKDALDLLGPIADGNLAGPIILDNAGRAALALGQAEKAEAYLRRAVAKAPDSPAARDLGLVLGSDGRTAESYELLHPWALAHPDDADARLSAAFDAIELQRAAEGEELLKSLPADNPRIQFLRARLLLLKDDPKGALALLEPLVKTGPPELQHEIQRNLARTYLGVGDSKRAIELLQGKTGTDLSLAILLGRAEYQASNPAATVSVLAPFAKADLAAADPTAPADRAVSASLELEYGQALLAQSHWTEAIPALERSTRLEPTSYQAWQLLARAQLAAGQKDAAAKSMDKVRELQAAKKPG
jgi:predicted Zn-dependent protease